MLKYHFGKSECHPYKVTSAKVLCIKNTKNIFKNISSAPSRGLKTGEDVINSASHQVNHISNSVFIQVHCLLLLS